MTLQKRRVVFAGMDALASMTAVVVMTEAGAGSTVLTGPCTLELSVVHVLKSLVACTV